MGGDGDRVFATVEEGQLEPFCFWRKRFTDPEECCVPNATTTAVSPHAESCEPQRFRCASEDGRQIDDALCAARDHAGACSGRGDDAPLRRNRPRDVYGLSGGLVRGCRVWKRGRRMSRGMRRRRPDRRLPRRLHPRAEPCGSHLPEQHHHPGRPGALAARERRPRPLLGRSALPSPAPPCQKAPPGVPTRSPDRSPAPPPSRVACTGDRRRRCLRPHRHRSRSGTRGLRSGIRRWHSPDHSPSRRSRRRRCPDHRRSPIAPRYPGRSGSRSRWRNRSGRRCRCRRRQCRR